jgi:hypothetical protein
LAFSPNRKDPKVKEQIKALRAEKKKFPGDLAIPMPGAWTEVTRLGHYGTTELQAKHVKYPGPNRVVLEFVGKSGVLWKLEITDPALKQALRNAQEGKADQEPLFTVKRRHVDKQFKKYKALPKDLRTYAAGKKFVEESMKFPVPKTEAELNFIEKQIFEQVSQALHNTPGMAKNSYVPPSLYAAWRSGALKKIEKQLEKSMTYYVVQIDDLEKSANTCPYDGSQAVQLRRYYQAPYWIREFKCKKGHVFHVQG